MLDLDIDGPFDQARDINDPLGAWVLRLGWRRQQQNEREKAGAYDK